MEPVRTLDARTLYEFVKSTASNGTNFSDGLRGGDFSLSSFQGFGQGAELGNLRTYTIMPLNKATFASGTIPSNTYIPIPKNYNINGELCYKFDFPRTIKLTGEDTYSNVVISGFDRFNQKVVCSGNPESEYFTFVTARAFAAVTSITFATTSVEPGATIIAEYLNAFELPFNDLGYQSNLLNVIGDDALSIGENKWTASMVYYNNSNVPTLNADYTPATWVTELEANAGTPRPIVDFSGSSLYVPNGQRAVTFLMSAYSFPTLPKYQTTATEPTQNPEYLENNFNVAFGIPNYKIGWTPFVG